VHSLKGSARLVSCLPFVENKAHIHMLCVYGLKCWRRSPAALSLVLSYPDSDKCLICFTLLRLDRSSRLLSMSALYAEDADITTDSTKRSNYKNLKNLRLEQRSTKSQYKCIPRWTRRTHFKLSATDKTVVTDETLIFALYHPSTKIPGGWPGDKLDFARAKVREALCPTRDLWCSLATPFIFR